MRNLRGVSLARTSMRGREKRWAPRRTEHGPRREGAPSLERLEDRVQADEAVPTAVQHVEVLGKPRAWHAVLAKDGIVAQVGDGVVADHHGLSGRARPPRRPLPAEVLERADAEEHLAQP